MPSCPRGRYRLVGALAATEHLELPSKDCFSGFRQTVAENDHVGI
jgi:hypothetical protein